MLKLIPIPSERIYVGLIGYVHVQFDNHPHNAQIPLLCEVIDINRSSDRLEIIPIGSIHSRLWIYATAIYQQVSV